MGHSFKGCNKRKQPKDELNEKQPTTPLKQARMNKVDAGLMNDSVGQEQ